MISCDSVPLNQSSLSSVQGTYLLLTEFEGCTVNYGLRFSPSIYGPSTKRAGYKLKGQNKGS